MTSSPTHGRNAPPLPRKITPKTDAEDDVDADDDVDDEPDDDVDDDDAESDEDDADDDVDDDTDPEEDEENDDEADEDPPPRPRRARRGDARGAPGSSGMGRPSTGPARRPAAAQSTERRAAATQRTERAAAVNAAAEPESSVDSELAPDISTWPGTTEAAKIVGRHTSTIKLWRTQNRIRALQDASGCWRHHPDDLAEAIDVPDGTDPGSVLASGMSAIVQQGANANERLLAMTSLTTDGLKETIILLRIELKRVYDRNEVLENRISELRDKHAATHADDLKHERFIKKLELKHELDVTGASETSVRLNGLLAILGPIAASIGARLLGNVAAAEKHERQMASNAAAESAPAAPSPGSSSGSAADPSGDAAASSAASSTASPAAAATVTEPSTLARSTESRLVPVETRIADAMGRLCVAIRLLDKPAFAGLRAMLPPNVAAALDDVSKNESDSAVGRALAIIVKAAQNLSDLQFRALRPIAPADVAAALSELRAIIGGDGEETRVS